MKSKTRKKRKLTPAQKDTLSKLKRRHIALHAMSAAYTQLAKEMKAKSDWALAESYPIAKKIERLRYDWPATKKEK